MSPTYTHKNLIAAGWGLTKWQLKVGSPVLMFADLDIVPLSKCHEINKRPRYKNSQICSNAVGKDTCSGDSGSFNLFWKFYLN